MLTRIVAAIGDAIGAVITFLPTLLAFLAVLLIGYIVAKALQRLTDAVLKRVGFDRLMERGGMKSVLARSRIDASDLMGRGVFWVAMIFTLQLAFGVFGPNPISAVLTSLIAYLPNVFAAALIVVIAAAVAAVVRDLVSAALGNVSWGKAVANGTAVAIIGVAAFAAASQLGIAPAIVNGLFYAILATVAGVLIVAVGGSGVMPMREYWTRALRRAEEEAPQMQQQARQAPERMKERAQERMGQAQEAMGGRPATERRTKEIPVTVERRRSDRQMPVAGAGAGRRDTVR